MKIMFYALRPFDEQAYCDPYSKQYGIDYAYTAEVPTPDNLELAKGCDAVSTNPCLIAPEYLEAWAAGCWGDPVHGLAGETLKIMFYALRDLSSD